MKAGDHNGQEERTQIGTQIGALLAKKRREKGLSLRDVEQATKIRTRYLEGLERDDYDMLPDAVYVQGFLKTYANFLGLDGERLSRELRDRRAPRRERQLIHEDLKAGEFEQPLVALGGLGGAERRRISGTTILTVTLAVLVLAVVIGALYLIGSRSAEGPSDVGKPEAQKETPSEPEPSPPPAEQTTTEPPSATPTTETPRTIRATVRVANASSGLTIRTDGTVAADVAAQPGFSQSFEARDSITVSASNAGAVEVEVDGQNMGRLGNYGQGATRTFNRQPGG